MEVVNCKQCGTPKKATSQNTEHQFCNQVCYHLHRSANKIEPKDIKRTPTGKFPMFV